MPKNNADAKYSRANNKADTKDSQQNHASITEIPQMTDPDKTAVYVPSLNGVTKNET
ncbi:hypothetical protein [Paenibacillus sp. DMB5]|uniref:hypothetical protein n=1 Tax=Paenibacillus sp. DMB5 TaxID=1780103 RepID=UPI000AE977CF|nr:hypothetical protein [Paenibacillus sp. DMB5]